MAHYVETRNYVLKAELKMDGSQTVVVDCSAMLTILHQFFLTELPNMVLSM